MKLMKLNYLFALLLVGLSIVSCTKKDEEAPQMTDIRVNGIPFNGRFNVGSDLDVEVSMKDDRKLKSFLVEVYQMDGINISNQSGFKVLSYSNIQEVSGKSASNTFTLTVPSNTTSGLYVIEVTAKDAAGNDSKPKIFELIIESPSEQPSMKKVDILEGGTVESGVFKTSRGRKLRFQSVCKDTNGGIKEIWVRIVNPYQTVIFSQRESFESPSEEFDLANLNFDVEVPFDAASIRHNVQFFVKDGNDHIKFVQRALDIQY